MRKTRVGLILGGCLVWLGAVSGCGGSTDGGTSATPVPKEEFSQRAAKALCDSIEPCCNENGFTYDAAACESAFKAFLDEELVAPAEKGGATYDPNAAGTCIAGLDSAKCGVGEAPEVCERIFVGTKAAGEACMDDVECARPPGGDADCDKGDADQGVCVQEPRGKLGDGCDSTCTDHGDGSTSCGGFGPSPSGGTAQCWTNDGLFCAEGSGKCEGLIAIGGACQYEGCVDGAYCASGKCAAKLPAGGECSFSSEACADGLYCADDNKCTAKKPDGAQCQSYDECIGDCEQGVCAPDGSGLASPEICAGQFPK